MSISNPFGSNNLDPHFRAIEGRDSAPSFEPITGEAKPVVRESIVHTLASEAFKHSMYDFELKGAHSVPDNERDTIILDKERSYKHGRHARVDQ